MQIFRIIGESAAQTAVAKATALEDEGAHRALKPFGYRRLNRVKWVNGKRYQLHATRGWKAA